jgi:ABC-type branched-subunit amino acid transport system permease subunit
MPKDNQGPQIVDPANRTSLAWTRTAVAFAAIGGAMLKVSPVAGSVVLVLSLPIWAVAHRRRGADASAASLRRLRLVTATVVIVALAALAVAIFGRSPESLGELLRGR